MSRTRELSKARNDKKDEFYTQLVDIEKELVFYRDHFKDAVVFCNCDDPYESNFFKFFALNFNYLGLKKLITTGYAGSPITGKELPLLSAAGLDTPPKDQLQAHKIEITEVLDNNNDGAIDLADVEWLLKNKKNTLTLLEGDGDFRSEECVELLKEADIVVTNPPFSLFRVYIAQLMEYGKKFLIIGNLNSISYVDVFPLITSNQVWFGPSISGGDREFGVPDSYPLEAANCRVDENGKKFIRVKGVRWYTNMDHPRRHEPFPFAKNYTPDEYPKFVNYDAIEVGKTLDIPDNYYEEMGVPLSFLDKHNPAEFDIIGSSRELGRPMKDIAPKGSYVQGGMRFYLDNGNGTYKRQYERIVIRRKRL